jgi:hypothetical protein
VTNLADLVAAYTRTPTATAYLNNQRWYAIQMLSTHQKFKENVSTGQLQGRDPPVTPQIGMPVRWTWGYNGYEVAGFTGEISGWGDSSYPDRWSLSCNDVLWRADKSSQVLQTSPLNSILASAAVRYLLTHYGGISAGRLSIPALPASGAAWAGSEWTLGVLTPVQWGDVDTQSGGTTALRAAAEICSCLGYWLYADSGGIIRAKQMERRPSQSAREVFRRAVNLLINGAPERQQSYENVYNQTTVRGADTGVDGAQLYDQYRTSSPLLPSGVYRDFPFSSILLEYENAADAGAASVTEVAKRILNVVSRIPDVVPLRAKADPNRRVGDTVGLIDSGILLSTQKNYFIYQIDRSLNLDTYAFDDKLLLDGGTGNTGFTTVPPPDASFSCELMAESLDGDAVVEVSLDGSASTSPSGEIVSWAWSTSTPTYGATPNSATGVNATLIFLASDSPADITLVVTDTTSKTDSFAASVDLTGADTRPPLSEVVSGAAGSAWYATPDGGATWNSTSGDAISVGTIGAGADDRAAGTAGTYGLLATRGSGGAAGLRQTLDVLATSPTNLVSNSGAITSNIWVNEANPARVWFAIGTAVYRSIDGGVTKVAMHAAPDTVSWIMEDPSVENSIFLLAGADMLNATDPTVGYAVLYAGPLGATARQFVRSRDGQVTWVCYTGAPSGEALQRVETGALADLATTDIRSLALSRQASSLVATLYAVTADDPAQLWSFDGLTGLSAAASSQTFPAGATVQHMLMSRLFDVIYTADFDSVAVGQGAFRKYFPQPDQLLLWKALASGEQGHMLGLGARASAPAEFLWISADTNPITIYHYKDGTWTARPLPVSASGSGVWITVDPFNTNRWLAVVNGNGGAVQVMDSGGGIVGQSGLWAHSPLWETEDAGVTWTEVVIPTPGGWNGGGTYRLIRATFNDQTGNSWRAAIYRSDDYYTAVVTGSGATVTTITEITAYSAPGIVSGADGETILIDVFNPPNFNLDYVEYLDTSAVSHRPAGTSPGNLVGPADRLPGTSRALFVIGLDTGDLFFTTDYRASQPTATSVTTNATSVACGSICCYFVQGGDLYRLVDPLTGFTISLINNAATFATEPRVDRQTRTHMGIGLAGGGGESVVLSDDGTATISIAGPPPTATTMSPAFDTIVRTS